MESFRHEPVQSLTVSFPSVSVYGVFLVWEEIPMKSPIILLSTFVGLALVSAGFAEAATKKTDPSQTAGTNYSQAMYQCTAQYAGNRSAVNSYRYAYIEGCFKALTGKYPADVGQSCQLRRC
jgi:hypothetical protein